MKKTNKGIARKLIIICVIFSVVGMISFFIGINKLTAYNNPDSEDNYTSDTSYVNAYVGGDAYNYIINGTYFTGYMVIAMGCAIIASMTGVGSAIITALDNNESDSFAHTSNNTSINKSDQYDDELPEI